MHFFENRTRASPGTFFTVSGTARMVPAEDPKMLIGSEQSAPIHKTQSYRMQQPQNAKSKVFAFRFILNLVLTLSVFIALFQNFIVPFANLTAPFSESYCPIFKILLLHFQNLTTPFPKSHCHFLNYGIPFASFFFDIFRKSG